jgi:hypothetical protein
VPTTERRTSRQLSAAFLLALLMTAAATSVAVLWDSIDARIVTADRHGRDRRQARSAGSPAAVTVSGWSLRNRYQ